MTLAANHQHRALLAIMAGGAAIVGLAVLTAGSLASTTHARTDATSTLGSFKADTWNLQRLLLCLHRSSIPIGNSILAQATGAAGPGRIDGSLSAVGRSHKRRRFFSTCCHGFRPCPRAAIRNEKRSATRAGAGGATVPFASRSPSADHLVAAVALGGVEACVGALDQGLRRVVRPQHRHADRDGDAAEDLAGRFLLQFLGHHRAADLIGDA